MNKEEIEELKRLLFQDRLTQNGKRKLVQYLEQLEFKAKANEKEHEYDVEMIDNVKGEAVKLYREIDRLNAILDKVVDKIKEDIKEITLPCTIVGGRRNGKTLEYGKKLGRIEVLKEILNIIEGERNDGEIIRSL